MVHRNINSVNIFLVVLGDQYGIPYRMYHAEHSEHSDPTFESTTVTLYDLLR